MPKILLVEDNAMNRDMLSRRLVRRGYEVIMAVDGQQGETMSQSELQDCVLMEIGLPVMAGWEDTCTLASAAATNDLPIIALTAHAMSTDREKAMEAGCDDYDTKPIELTRLIAKMEALLARTSKQPERAERSS